RTARQRYRAKVQGVLGRIVSLFELHLRDAPLAPPHVFNVGNAANRKRGYPAYELTRSSHLLPIDGCDHVAALQTRTRSRARFTRQIFHNHALAAGDVVQTGDLRRYFLWSDAQEPPTHSAIGHELVVDLHGS